MTESPISYIVSPRHNDHPHNLLIAIDNKIPANLLDNKTTISRNTNSNSEATGMIVMVNGNKKTWQSMQTHRLTSISSLFRVNCLGLRPFNEHREDWKQDITIIACKQFNND